LQTATTSIHQILRVLHEGGRIDRFTNGNVFLTNIFGELLSFEPASFEELLASNFLIRIHLHFPCAECFKISGEGLAFIRIKNPGELCPIPA